MLEPKIIYLGNLTDELQNIVAGCMDGKRLAQEQLYRMFASKMYGVCLRYSSSTVEAQDALQEGFIKAFAKVGQFKNKGSFEGWLRRIMVNTSLESYRRKHHTIIVDQMPDLGDDDDDEPELNITENELLSFIQSLPQRYRMVFNLYVFEKLGHKEIAQELGITEGTSKSDLSRARGILQKKVIAVTKKVAKIG